ncbi:MAG: sigma-70 family RNA polymerase sigma factor [Bacteroidota bacterium]
MIPKSLIHACMQEDAHAQHELFTRMSPMLMGICMRYAQNLPEAEDILQEGFIKIFQKIKKYNFQGSWEGWVRRIMINTAIDYLRKQKAYRYQLSIEEGAGNHIEAQEIDQLELEYLYQVIQELPPGYRLVFNLYAIEGYSHKEIAQQLGISESTSRSQYTRARAILIKRIREDCMETNTFKNAI